MSISEGTRKGRLRTFSGKIRFGAPCLADVGGPSWPPRSSITANRFSQGSSGAYSRNVWRERTWPPPSAGTLSVAGMEMVPATALRNAKNSAGQKVRPEHRLTDRAIQIGNDRARPARVTRLARFGHRRVPHLSSDTAWYAVADSQLSAPISRLVLQPSPDPRFSRNARHPGIRGRRPSTTSISSR